MPDELTINFRHVRIWHNHWLVDAAAVKCHQLTDVAYQETQYPT